VLHCAPFCAPLNQQACWLVNQPTTPDLLLTQKGTLNPQGTPEPQNLKPLLPLPLPLLLHLSPPPLFLRYALTGKEVKMILMQRLVKVDGKVRTDVTYPAGFMDVITLDKTDDHFR